MKKETGGGIRKWFIRERENKPSVLFFDEIDSIATSRDIGEDVNSQAIAEKTEKNETDPETVPQEEMKKLRQEEDMLDDTLQGLASALEDVRDEVFTGQGDAFKKWEESVKDLIPEE